ncbi:SDR family oxidoreductase [Reyranella sp.]|uniref:SDR family oxidoreductase n=1 Tax=Reyranella sp. TaxID=1929291 RepID=UPI002731D506|nr:SDR family oxidoreductase [Reyranella sp.]MDP2372771.1 SDR family oxidoreductase [Reyranella sp.]
MVRILLTGANGFIGGQFLAGLRARGHEVVAAVRDPEALRRKLPGIEAIAVDFNRDTSVKDWRPRLEGIDAVINCAGVLHGGRGQDIEAIHAVTPIALFDACVATGVRRVVQISAISADTEAGTEYALTKKRADDHLRSLPIDWTVLRPSLVYGDGSYGGTSALRGLAGLPLVGPLVGDETMAFRPLHIEDLVETVARVIAGERFARQTLEPVGPDVVTLRELVAKYRAWLGLKPTIEMPIPLPVMQVAARVVDMAGGGPLGTMSLRQLLAGNVGSEPAGVFARAIGFAPRSLGDMLARRPAQTQDVWHARLYFLRPVLRLALALMWLGSAVAGLLAPVASYAAVDAALTTLGLPTRALAIAFSVLDLLIAAALLVRWNVRLLAATQIVIVAGYTLALTILAPSLWLDPFGALLKNLPILVAIGIWAVLEDER